MTTAAVDPVVQDLQRHRLLLALLRNASSTLRQSRGAEEAIQSILRGLCDQLGWPVGAFYLVDGQDQVEPRPHKVHAEPGTGPEALRVLTGANAEAPGDPLRRSVRRGAPDWVMDVTKDPDFHAARAAVALGVRGRLALPVADQGAVYGALEFYSTSPMEPREDLLEVLSEIAGQLGATLRHQRVALALERMQTRKGEPKRG